MEKDTWTQCPTNPATFGPHGGAQWRSPRYMIRCGCDLGYCERHANIKVLGGPKMEPGAPRTCRSCLAKRARIHDRISGGTI